MVYVCDLSTELIDLDELIMKKHMRVFHLGCEKRDGEGKEGGGKEGEEGEEREGRRGRGMRAARRMMTFRM